MLEIFLITASFVLTVIGVGLFRRWSLARGILDVPNERSSHDQPTPRGGGVIIVLVTLVVFAAYGLISESGVSWAFVATSLILAGIGWLDDLYSIPFYIRLSVHFATSVIFVAAVGHYGSIFVPGTSAAISLGPIGYLFTIGWIVWMINAYNFMDGIDGIAGIQGVSAGIAWAIFGVILPSTELVVLGGILAAVCCGFLVFNWSPAKIFMGDVGSSFLGFAFAVAPLLAVNQENGLNTGYFAYAAVAFVWLFFLDTVITLVRRLIEGKRVWKAHREHAYQQLVIAGASHASVSILYGLLATMISSIVLIQFRFGGNFEYLSLFSLLIIPAIIGLAIRAIK